MRPALRALIAALVLVALWEALVRLTGLPNFILPAPERVVRTLWTSRALIAEHAAVTLAEVLLGLVAGAALGAATALLMAVSGVARMLIQPALVLTQALPVFALAPILTLWLGYGLGSKVLMAVLIIYFPVASAFFDGLMRMPSGWADLGQVMGASRTRMLWHMQVPAAVPSLASGLKLAAVYAPIGAIIGEWVGASKGLGYLMLLANGRAKTDLMFAALIVLAVMTLALHRGIGRACDALVARMR